MANLEYQRLLGIITFHVIDSFCLLWVDLRVRKSISQTEGDGRSNPVSSVKIHGSFRDPLSLFIFQALLCDRIFVWSQLLPLPQ